jgi:hypothetical protein
LNDCLADVAAIFANWAAQLPAPEIPARTHRHGADVG